MDHPDGYDGVEFGGEHVDGPPDGLDLRVTPDAVEPPATVTFEVTNDTAVPVDVAPNVQPAVYRSTGERWEQLPIAAPLVFPEYVPVADAYSYTVDVPFGDWNPVAGAHLFLVVVGGGGGGSGGVTGDAVALPSNAVSLVREPSSP